ncbi:Multidrug resistance-associated protein 1 [Nymphon striatum]|nr:Multidrug resistance-associated protein 1 [Nymphon striatum]
MPHFGYQKGEEDNDLTWNTTNPDFTECFHRTVIVWIPAVFLWIFAPYEAYTQVKSRQRLVPWNGINLSKLIICILLIFTTLAELIYSVHRHISSINVPSVDYNTPFLQLITYCLITLLIVSGRRRGIRSSGPLFLYWFLSVVLGIITFRSRLMRASEKDQDQDTVFFVTFLIAYPLNVIQLLIACFADRRPVYTEYSDVPDDNICPEESASFLSEVLFWWLSSFMVRGFRNPLTQDDLWNLNCRDLSKNVAPHFDKYWSREKAKYIQFKNENNASFVANSDSVKFHEKKKKAGSPSVLFALMKAFWPRFVFGAFFKLLSDVLAFTSPQLLSLLIDYTSSNEPRWKGIFYAVALFLCAESQSIFLNQYFVRMNIVALHVRTALISAIYRKSLKLSNEERKDTTLGEIVNLMSIDTQRFIDVMPFANMLWSGPLQIFLALFFLWGTIGPSVLAGVGVMILMIPVNAVLAGITRKLQIQNMKLKDERTKLMNEVLNGIKVLKLYAWEIPFVQMILDIRNKEIQVLTKSAYLSAGMSFLWSCAPLLVSLASFATYVLVDKNNILDAKTAFVSLALFNLLRFPLNMLPNLISMLIQISVSLKRLNKFMSGEELDTKAVSHNHNEGKSIQLSLRVVQFSWDNEDESPVLKDINLRVKPGSLVAVVGQVGSGKSSLIGSILGELTKQNGHVNVKGSIAYVPQQAWIQNATAKDNILMYKQLNQDFYDKIVESCALKSDFEMLPTGDETEIGEKGINLSGGQKQRISIARALFHKSDIYLMDDPLSAVDAHVGKHIFEEVIGPNSLLKGKTRLLVTHGVSYLPQCDMIVVLKDGKISESGSYKQLVCNKGAFSEFIVQYLADDKHICEEELEELDKIISQVPVAPEIKRQFSRQISKSESETSSFSPNSPNKRSLLEDDVSIGSRYRRSSSRSVSVENEKKPAVKVEKNKLIEAEKMETDGVKFSVYSAYMKRVGYFMSCMIFFFWLVSQACAVGSNIWLSFWSNNAKRAVHDTDFRNLLLGIYGTFGVGQAITIMIGALCLAFGTMRATAILHEKMLSSVMKSPMSFFDTTPSGRIVNRFSKDVNTMDITIAMNLRGFLLCFLSVLSCFFVISMETPYFMIVIIPVMILYYFVSKFYIATSRQLKRIESVTRSPIYVHFSETVSGASSIRAYGVQNVFIDESNHRVDTNHVCYYPALIANRWLAIRIEFIGNCIILFAALFAVLGRDTLDAGSVGLSISYAISVIATLNWMVRTSSELETNLVSIERIIEYSSLTSEGEWNIKATKPKSSWPDEGQVTFNSYKTRYREGLDLVLKGIDCEISAGEKIGICGRTGAGKSSLTLALFRIIEAASGSIVIDGVDISKLGLHELRSKLTIIPQDPVLFSGSLRQNIDPFDVYSDEKVWTALEHCHLKSFVKGFDEGLLHKVTEGGENLSVGQRQLICLGRALLRKTKVLVLDEATAAVDLETDDLIQETIRKEFYDCTILTIAHRLNTIMDSTRVLVLDQGLLAEFDSPANLLQNNKSIFYGMARDSNLV